MTDSSQLAVPPPRGWRIPEALSHLPEEELRARFATRELRLRGFKSSKEGLEAVSTEADPLWAAEAELSPKFNIAVGPSLISPDAAFFLAMGPPQSERRSPRNRLPAESQTKRYPTPLSMQRGRLRPRSTAKA